MENRTGNNLKSIILLENPSDADKNLIFKKQTRNKHILLGWVIDKPLIDDIMPDDVMDLLASALSKIFQVSFLYKFDNLSDRFKNKNSYTSFLLEHNNPLIKLFKLKFPFLSTHENDIIKLSFDADYFTWSLRGQLLLLSTKGYQPEKITYEFIDKFFRKWKIDFFNNENNKNLQGLLFPTQDGDFLECLFIDEIQAGLFKKKLSEECLKKSVEYREVNEFEFQNINWFLNSVTYRGDAFYKNI